MPINDNCHHISMVRRTGTKQHKRFLKVGFNALLFEHNVLHTLCRNHVSTFNINLIHKVKMVVDLNFNKINYEKKNK